MRSTDLPDRFRPTGLRYKRLNPGIDLPAWLIDEIKSIDPHLYGVYHPYRVLYEDIMNQYTGPVDDPRFTIGANGADEVWGYILTDGNKEPIPEHTWHCWRVGDYGWSHIFEIKYLAPEYLRKLVKRLGMQKIITERYGLKAYMRHLQEEREMFDEMDQAAKASAYDDVQKANRWLLDKAMDNFDRGVTAPTRPTKQVIQSGPWSHRGSVEREITDEEGGLLVPDK